MSTLLDVITEANLLATGKATAPANTTSRYATLKSLANYCQRMWQDEPTIDGWDSLYITVSLPSTISATDTYALTASVREISRRDGDYIYVLHTDGTTKTYYELVEIDQLQSYAIGGYRVVARNGSNLVFSIAFTSADPQFGGTIKIPCYTTVSTLSDDSNIVQVDDPTWPFLAMAAEYCRVKTSLQGRVDGLVARANEVMDKMKAMQDGNNSSTQRESIGISRTW